MKVCFSCAATESDGARFAARKSDGAPRLCADCQRDMSRAEINRISPLFQYRRRARVTTRARYRAKLRVRLASPQLDLVDLLVAAP